MPARRLERRNWPRTSIEWEVLLGELRYPVLRARGLANEINPGGCRVLSDETIEKGEAVRMLIATGKNLLHLKGKVVHSNCLGDGEFELGISFGEMSARSISVIGEAAGKQRPPPNSPLTSPKERT